MAAIDKIYGTLAEYDELYEWANRYDPAMLQYFCERRADDIPPDKERAITSFPMEVDGVVILACPIFWVLERIIEQYDLPLAIKDDR